jgi:hypothetical protein
MLNFSNRQTTLDLNGPVLSIVQQPESVSIPNLGIATFVGFSSLSFPTQIPANNPSNSGILTQRWYVDGYGPLSDGSIVSLGITVVGSATTTLTISGAISPTASNLGFFMRSDYIPSAYSQPVGSTVVAGTARSTGNASNEPFDTNIATLTVFPTITIVDQPQNSTVAQGRFASFFVNAELSDTSQGNLSYSWTSNGNILSDGPNVIGSNSQNLLISSNTVGISTVRSIITHPTSTDSPVYSNVVNYQVVAARQIVTFENIYSSSSAGITDKNLFDGQVIIGSDIPRSLLSFYASENDLDVEMEIHGSSGSSFGSNRGGIGGYSKIRFTMKKDEEYVIAGLGAFTGNSVFLYRKSRLIANVANGGNASSSGRGGDGGGVNVGGERGGGRGGGNGGILYLPGTLPISGGIFGSAVGNIIPPVGSDSLAPVPLGGRALPCPRGNQTVSPCTDLGLTQFLWGQRTPIPGTGRINRGFKQGYGIRNTPGLGSGGGNGGGGTTGGDGGTSGGGGGGGGGYTDGSVEVIETQLGGSQYTSAVAILKLISPSVTFVTTREAAFENTMTFTKVSGTGVGGMSFGPNYSVQTFDIQPGAVYRLTSATGRIRFFGTQRIGLDDSAGDNDFNDIAVSCDVGSFYESGGSIFYTR